MKQIVRWLVLFLVLFVACLGVFYYLKIKDEPVVVEKKVTDEIVGLPYQIHDLDSTYYKSEFKNLKTVLTSEVIDDKAYAETVSKMFAANLYTLDNKITKSDIGGLEFIVDSFKENFILNVSSTLYKYVETNIYNDRDQELPEVTGTEIIESISSTFTIDEIEYPSYEVTLNLTYKVDLGYETDVKVILIKDEDSIYVVGLE